VRDFVEADGTGTSWPAPTSFSCEESRNSGDASRSMEPKCCGLRLGSLGETRRSTLGHPSEKMALV